MRIPSSHDKRERRDDASMTPMIDVVFLLLIFFVCASVGQIRESLLPTDLAAGDIAAQEVTESPRPLGEVWLRLRQTATGETIAELNDREYTDVGELKETLAGLAELAPEIPVIFDIDGEVPLGKMIEVYDICRAVDFESISFATAPQSKRDGGP